MSQLKRLKANIELLIEAEYPDEAFDETISDCWCLSYLNEALENELDFCADCAE